MDKARCCAVYSRKSRFTGRGESIDNQVELCRAHIAAQFGGESRVLVYEDEGFSGSSLQRPAFRRLMEDARRGAFDAVVCYRLDRISRSIGDFAGLIEELGGLGVDFVSIREQFDTSSPLGRAMMYIASVFSQLERETIAERIRDNMLELAKTGRWLGGVTPTGYRSVAAERISVDGKTRRAHRLELIPEQADTVRSIYEQFLRSHSLTGVEGWLRERGLRSKNGKAFSRHAVRDILRNPVYQVADAAAWEYWRTQGAELCAAREAFDGRRGMMVFNKTAQAGGKAHELHDVSEWIVSVGAHEGLVPGAQWVRAQELLARNRSKSYRRARRHTALLSGRVVCGVCGARLRPRLTQRVDARGEPVFRYACCGRERSRGAECDAAAVDGGALDRAVGAAVCGLEYDRAAFARCVAELLPALRDEQRAERERLDDVQTRCEREIGALLEALKTAGDTPARQRIAGEINALQAQGDGAREGLRALAAREETWSTERLAKESRRLLPFPACWAALAAEAQREVVAALVECVVVDAEGARVVLQEAECAAE